MRRLVFLVGFLVVAGSALVFASGQGEQASGAWQPTRTVKWYCTSSPGGGSSIFTQEIIKIIHDNNLVGQNITIEYKTDGGGAVGRRQVSGTRSEGHTLLTFNNGDLQPFVQIEGGRLNQLTPIAVMATDGQILLVRADSPYSTAKDFISAVKSGKKIVVSGSKGDDINLFNKMKEAVGGNMVNLVNDSTGKALTQLLGGSADVAIAKPAASFQLVESGKLKPLIAATPTRFGQPFDAPTFKELGYNIELSVYRGIVGPKDMPKAAVEYWSEVFKKVSETMEWKNDYLKKFLLTGHYLPYDKALTYMKGFEDRYLSSM